MSTRSDIIVKVRPDCWRRIYCHYDGYLEHVGLILATHYNTAPRAIELTAEGDLSSLAENCTKPAGHSFKTPVASYCVYYGRDRGETNTAAQEGPTLEAVWPSSDSWTQFSYVWDGDRWLYTENPHELGPQDLAPLVPRLVKDAALVDA
jgi:hypothetical protein